MPETCHDATPVLSSGNVEHYRTRAGRVSKPVDIHSFISLISASDKTHSLLQLVRKQVTVHV